MRQPDVIHGLLAEFAEDSSLLDATRRAYADGYRRMDAYSPFPVEGLAEALGRRRSVIPLWVLSGGLVGATGGYFLQWYASVIDYPLNVGGRPLNSWPQFVPITFELTVLIAALSGVLGMLILNRLPQPYHPVFNAAPFTRASVDRFFLCIEASDPKFDPEQTRRFLETLSPDRITEVPK
jgi:hypothetical protein